MTAYLDTKGMQKEIDRCLLFVVLLLLVSLACGLPNSEPAPATATPEGNMLTFGILSPTYTASLNAGDHVPGAPMYYVGQEGDAYRVRIGGQDALKRSGDSFIWSGIIAPGSYAEYNLRLTSGFLGPLPVAGGVDVTFLDWQALELTNLPDVSSGLHFGNIPIVETNLQLEETLRGATLTYQGIYKQGNQEFAHFTGLSAQPYYAQGDSLVWSGQLRSNVYVRYNLRVVSFNESRVILGGTADLWVLEQTYP